MNPMDQLMQMAQAAGVGGPLQGQRLPKAPGGMQQPSGGGGKGPKQPPPDLLAQLQALSSGSDPGSVQGQVMQSMAGGPGGRLSSGEMDPMVQALMRAENAGMVGTGRGPATDGELMDMAIANQSMRGNLPIQNRGMDMTGFSSEVEPMDDIRQTPAGEDGDDVETVGLEPGQDRGLRQGKKGGSPGGMPAFAQEGRSATGSPSGMPSERGKRARGTPSGLKHMPTAEEELAMVSDRMGGETGALVDPETAKDMRKAGYDPTDKAHVREFKIQVIGDDPETVDADMDSSPVTKGKKRDLDDDGDHEYR